MDEATGTRLRDELRALLDEPLTQETAEDYVRRLDALAKTYYQEAGLLERPAYTDPGDAAAQAAYSQFLREAKDIPDDLIKQAHLRLQPVFSALPAAWQASLRPAVFVPYLGEDVTAALAEIDSQAEAFSALQYAVTHQYPDGRERDVYDDQVSPDREVRREAAYAYAACERAALPEYQALFLRLHAARQAAARMAGYADYRELVVATPLMAERHFTQEGVRAVREQIRTHICPRLTELRAIRAELLGAGQCQPWDLPVSILGRRIVGQAQTPELALDRLGEVLGLLGQGFASSFAALREQGAFAIFTEADPYRQSYAHYLPVSRQPWMVLWYTRAPVGVFMLTHEVGHCLYHQMLPPDTLLYQRYPTRDYGEFLPQLLEGFISQHLEAFFPDHLAAVKLTFFERVLSTMVMRVMLDEFQDEVYARPALSADELQALFETVSDRYPTGVTGEAALNPTGWAGWHTFVQPYYGIEYVLAWGGVLQWLADPRPEVPVAAFTRSADASASDLFADLGLELLPSDATWARLSGWLEQTLQSLRDQVLK